MRSFPPRARKAERSGFTASMKPAFLSIREVSRSRSNVRQSHAGSSWATNLNIPTSIDPGSGLAPVNMAQPVSPPGTKLRLIIRWSAGDNPIEVFRVALSLHQSLPPPSGATRPVRKPWCAIVERRNDGFRFHRHLVDGTIGEIDEFFRMSDRERRIRACVSSVRRCRRVTLLQRRGQRAVADGSRPAAIADGLELSVPINSRHPDLNLDVRVRRGS